MPEKAQTLKNHARLLPPYHLFVLPVLLLNVLNALRHVWTSPDLHDLWALVVAAALLALGLLARTMTLTVQDRVIRLEMRMRLRELLPADLQPRIAELTPRQLIAMRFACDAELSDLTRAVLSDKLDPKSIKARVKDWQADWLRA
ncbi:MAG TPA: DUF6526 family protein [Vicinamibacterales bacterium]|nr:DUF6526 family protein [Vicinamibacterales bacterium]